MVNNFKNPKEYDDFTIIEVWRKAIPYKRFELYKKDCFGSIIFFDDYGIKSEKGWEIVNIKSRSQSGTDDIENLIPVHWRNIDRICPKNGGNTVNIKF
jgi:hypothetical protein